MTQYYTDIKTGKEIKINIKGNEYLNKITLGIFPKMGISDICSPEDCQLVSRIIRNYNWYLKNASSYTLDFYRVERLSPEEMRFMEKVADFFENAKEGVEVG